jgi:hypothetical protein
MDLTTLSVAASEDRRSFETVEAFCRCGGDAAALVPKYIRG